MIFEISCDCTLISHHLAMALPVSVSLGFVPLDGRVDVGCGRAQLLQQRLRVPVRPCGDSGR